MGSGDRGSPGEVIVLPEEGIRGNSHLFTQANNSAIIANRVVHWMNTQFIQPPVPPNQPPVAVISPQTQTVISQEIQLDGSKSFDPDGEEVTCSWKLTGKPAALMNATTATPIVQFGSGPGDYNFDLTVMDPHGATDTTTTTVSYQGR